MVAAARWASAQASRQRQLGTGAIDPAVEMQADRHRIARDGRTGVTWDERERGCCSAKEDQHPRPSSILCRSGMRRSGESSRLLRSVRRDFSSLLRDSPTELVASCRAASTELRTSPRGESASLAWSALTIPSKAIATTTPLISHHPPFTCKREAVKPRSATEKYLDEGRAVSTGNAAACPLRSRRAEANNPRLFRSLPPAFGRRLAGA